MRLVATAAFSLPSGVRAKCELTIDAPLSSDEVERLAAEVHEEAEAALDAVERLANGWFPKSKGSL